MAITRKPKASVPAASSAVDVEALINKGGSVATSATASAKPADETTPVVLRVPSDVLGRVDRRVEARKTQGVKVPRHTWLLEAVIEKLAREEKASN